MYFTSYIEAYSYTLLQLNELKTKYKDFLKLTVALDICLDQVKFAVENHNNNASQLCQFIKTFLLAKSYQPDFPLTSDDKEQLSYLIKVIESSPYRQIDIEKFENPLARRLESEWAITLIKNPTPAMMQAVEITSKFIIQCLNIPSEKIPFLLDFLISLGPKSSSPIRFGCFALTPCVKTVQTILAANKPSQFAEIMNIHYQFFWKIFRDLPIKRDVKNHVVGKFSSIIRELCDKEEVFFHDLLPQSRYHRGYISDVKFSHSNLYLAEDGTRGRNGPQIKEKYYHCSGLMLANQAQYEKDLPQYPVAWGPDCKTQSPNLNSQYVRDLNDYNAVYVAGPSGMMACFMGLMETGVNFESIELKQHYLAAVCAFIVGGGYHSWHEVLGPAEYVLNLVPGYQVQPPTPGKLGPAPNFSAFFTQQEKIDPAMKAVHNQAWQRYLNFFKRDYLKILPDDIHRYILHIINSCISSFKHKTLTLFSEKEFNLLLKLKQEVQFIPDYHFLKQTLDICRSLIPKPLNGDIYGYKNALSKCLDEINSVLEEFNKSSLLKITKIMMYKK